MLQDKTTSSANYERFITRAIRADSVWGLKHPDGGWAICQSNQYEKVNVFVFWSDKAYAARNALENWANYQPCSIDLDAFIDSWLRGMHEDGHMVGLNWDAHLCGQEVEPIEVAKRLIGDAKSR